MHEQDHGTTAIVRRSGRREQQDPGERNEANHDQY
jgi:hypothetical protein